MKGLLHPEPYTVVRQCRAQGLGTLKGASGGHSRRRSKVFKVQGLGFLGVLRVYQVSTNIF